MRSLKIIIFRDTDKPYTIIIPSSILVTASFLVIATFTLLVFSLMGNVILYARTMDQNQQTAMVQNEDIAEKQEEPGDSTKTATDPIDVSSDNPADNQFVSGSQQVDAKPVEDDSVDQQPVQEDALASETTTPNSLEEDGEGTEAGFSAQQFDFVSPTATADAQLLDEPTVTDETVRFRAEVKKFQQAGVEYRGKFVAALADRAGNIYARYPSSAQIEENDVVDPDRGNSFRIRHRRNYTVTLQKEPGVEYAYIMIFIYDNDTNALHWRKAIPLR
jgi:hypothetical protein